MRMLRDFVKSLEITLVDENPRMPEFGKLDEYPSEMMTEYEQDKINGRKQK